MPFIVTLDEAEALFPDYEFIKSLTPSEQKAAFHVKGKNGVDFCLKIISPSYEMSRLSREILAIQSINHPNVVKLHEYTYSTTMAHQRHYMIEEYIDGKDLAEELIAGEVWSLDKLQKFFLPLFNGLGALENQNLVHRDLKPSNIRVRHDGSPVIIDFGLARHLDLPDLTRTSDGAAIGTPKYFAPEQFDGTKYDIDRRTDLFSVGVILYEAATGTHPFWHDGISYAELRDNVCQSNEFLQQVNFKNLPKNMRLIIKRLLEKERVRRPSSASQVSSIFKAIGA